MNTEKIQAAREYLSQAVWDTVNAVGTSATKGKLNPEAHKAHIMKHVDAYLDEVLGVVAFEVAEKGKMANMEVHKGFTFAQGYNVKMRDDVELINSFRSK